MSSPPDAVCREIAPEAGSDLEALRSDLDAIDHALPGCLRERIERCVAIAAVKREKGVPMMQPRRIGVVQRRAAEFATEHGIDAAFLGRLVRLDYRGDLSHRDARHRRMASR